MSAHTPGPWNIAGFIDGARGIQCVSFENGDPMIPLEGERMYPRTDTPYTLNLAFATKKERAKAARLIAAAPALLEALEHICETVVTLGGHKTEALEQARAAIAQAKGGKS